MGKQVGFFMLPTDERKFFEFLLRDPKIKIILENPHECKIEVVPTDELLQNGSQSLPWLLIWYSSIPIPADCLKTANLQKYDEVKMDFVPTGEIKNYISKGDAPVIEYSNCHIQPNGKWMQNRIWADLYYVRNNQWAYKGNEFSRFYDKVARWLRKNLERIEGKYGYFGSDVVKLYERGDLYFQNSQTIFIKSIHDQWEQEQVLA